MEQPLQSSAGNANSAAHTRYRIEDRSYLSIIKKEVGKAAGELGFSAQRIGRLDIIITELISNLVKYGERKRELLWKPFFYEGEGGIEILSIDAGGGIDLTGVLTKASLASALRTAFTKQQLMVVKAKAKL